MILNAKNNVPYYMRSLEGVDVENIGFEEIPFIDKESLRRFEKDFLSKQFSYSELIVEFTSGSTGRPIKLYKDNTEKVKGGLALFNNRRKFMSNVVNAPLLKFHALNINNNSIDYEPIIISSNTLSFSLFDLSTEKIIEYWKYIDRYKEFWMIGVPSAVYKIARCIDHNPHLKAEKIKFIELTGELVIPEQKKFIEKVFNCPVANFYGSREFWGIAYECKYGKLHVFNDLVYVEVIDNNETVLKYGEYGEIVITGLEKYAMPLIRYKQGDRVRLLESRCPCGNHADILEIEGGRVTDYIVTEEGTTINPILFYSIITDVNLRFGVFIDQFQVIQENLIDFTINLVVDSKFNRNHIISLFEKTMIDHIHKNVNLNFNFLKEIPQDHISGKFKYFYSNIK